MCKAKASFSTWESALAASLKEGRELPALAGLRACKVKSEAHVKYIYNAFAELGTQMMQTDCNALSQRLIKLSDVGDSTAIAAEIRFFSARLDNLFFFTKYRALPGVAVAELKKQVRQSLSEYIRTVKEMVQDPTAYRVDSVFECDMCLNKLALYE